MLRRLAAGRLRGLRRRLLPLSAARVKRWCAGEAGAPARLLRGGDRIGDRPAVPVAVDGPDADLVVVLVEPGDRVVGDVADPSCVRPERLGGVAPDDLV